MPGEIADPSHRRRAGGATGCTYSAVVVVVISFGREVPVAILGKDLARPVEDRRVAIRVRKNGGGSKTLIVVNGSSCRCTARVLAKIEFIFFAKYACVVNIVIIDLRCQARG